MKRVIFTTYDDIEQVKEIYGTGDHQAHQIKEYFDRLVDNKKTYAETIGVDFKFFHNTMKNFIEIDSNEFVKTNLYKHHLMANLAEEYDEVMYVDMDVIFNTTENVFEELDLSKGIYVRDQNDQIRDKNINNILFRSCGQRNPTIKYHITKDMLGGEDNDVLNTGIMIAKSEYIKKIKFLERMQECASIIENIKENNIVREDTNYLRIYYYPNNESIFSYILKKYNIPYVLMDKEWHYFIASDYSYKADWNEIKIAHFINKKFNIYYKDKKKCIYSLHIVIPEEKLDSPPSYEDDPVNKSKRAKEKYIEYEKDLLKNHQDYANAIGADYKHFGRDEEYEEFAKRFPDLSEYDIVNLYKVWLLDKLTYDYDLVLYVDFDVCFLQNVDVFDFLPGETSFCCDYLTSRDLQIDINNEKYLKKYKVDFRSPQSKYWNAHALLQERGLEGDHCVFNTGVMLASRKVMEQIDYFGDIEETIDTMKELKEFSMYPEPIQKSFGFDNETIMGYKTKLNDVNVYRLKECFHFKHRYDKFESTVKGTEEFKIAKSLFESYTKVNNIIIVHFISKNLGLFFDEA